MYNNLLYTLFLVYICNIKLTNTNLEIKMKRTRKKKNYNRISLGTIHREVLYKEFEGISRQSIDNALNYKTDSDLGRSIRAKAKELLKEEVKKLKIELDE